MMNGDFIDIDETDNHSILDSIEIKNLENDYNNQNIKHFLVSGLSGTGKTTIIHRLYKNDMLIAFSHGEDNKSSNRKTLFQCLFEEINRPFNSIRISPLYEEKNITVYQVLNYDSTPSIIKSTYFEKLPFFRFGYFLIDHLEELQKTLEQFKDISFKSWIRINVYDQEGFSETQIQEEIDRLWHSLSKLNIVRVYKLSDPTPFYIVSNYQMLTKVEKETLFKGVLISKESVCLSINIENLKNNLWKLKYKPLMNLEGIRNNLNQRMDVQSFDHWYELNKRSINSELFRKRFVTPYILFNMYLKDNLKLDLSYKTLFIDDYQLFANEEIDVLSKMMLNAKRTFITHDPIIKIFDFRNEKQKTGPRSIGVAQYVSNFSPKIYKLTENFRVDKENWLISEANKALDQISPPILLRYSNTASSTAQKIETPLIEMLKKGKGRVGVVFRTNEQIEKFCEILVKNKLNFTRVTNNFLETYIGNKYVSLFRYLLKNKPSEKFIKYIRENKTFNILNWDKFKELKKEFLNFNLNVPDVMFNVFNDGNKFKYLANFLLIETNEETLEKAMKKYLDEPFLYVYYHSHYYNQVYQHKPLINVLNFHKLKQISYFDTVIFPLIKEDSKGYNYLSIAKATRGFGLFSFQVDEGTNYKQNNQEIISDFDNKVLTITLFNKL